MDKDDPYASIMQVCHCQTQRSRLRHPPLVLPPVTTPPDYDDDEFPLYGAIPDHLIGNFLCCTPDPPNNIINQDNASLCVESSEVSPPTEDFLLPCVVSFEDSLLESSDVEGITTVDHHYEGQPIDGAVDCGCTDAHPCEDLGLWLSKLKSMAVSQEFFGGVVSFLAEFRASVSLSKEKNLGSLLKLKGKKVSASVSGELSSKKRKHSGNIVSLKFSRYNTRSKLVDTNDVNVIARSESFGNSNGVSNSSGGMTWRPAGQRTMDVDGGSTDTNSFKGSDMLLSKLKSMARLQGFFRDAVPFWTVFRAEYWNSEGLFSSKEKNLFLPSKSETIKRLVWVSDDPPSKKPKHPDNNLGLKSSTSKSGSQVVETEGAAEIILLDSEEEEWGEGVPVLGHNTVNEGSMPLKQCEARNSKADESHRNAHGNLAGNKGTEYLGKSNDIRSSAGGTKKCPAELREQRDSLTCRETKKNAATSGGMGPGSSSSKNGFVTMVLDALQKIAEVNPGGSSGNMDDDDGDCQTPWHDFPSAKTVAL